MKHQFQLTYLQGAEEVDLETFIESDVDLFDDDIQMELFLNVVKIQNGKLTSAVNKKISGSDLTHNQV